MSACAQHNGRVTNAALLNEVEKLTSLGGSITKCTIIGSKSRISNEWFFNAGTRVRVSLGPKSHGHGHGGFLGSFAVRERCSVTECLRGKKSYSGYMSSTCTVVLV